MPAQYTTTRGDVTRIHAMTSHVEDAFDLAFLIRPKAALSSNLPNIAISVQVFTKQAFMIFGSHKLPEKHGQKNAKVGGGFSGPLIIDLVLIT